MNFYLQSIAIRFKEHTDHQHRQTDFNITKMKHLINRINRLADCDKNINITVGLIISSLYTMLTSTVSYKIYGDGIFLHIYLSDRRVDEIMTSKPYRIITICGKVYDEMINTRIELPAKSNLSITDLIFYNSSDITDQFYHLRKNLNELNLTKHDLMEETIIITDYIGNTTKTINVFDNVHKNIENNIVLKVNRNILLDNIFPQKIIQSDLKEIEVYKVTDNRFCIILSKDESDYMEFAYIVPAYVNGSASNYYKWNDSNQMITIRKIERIGMTAQEILRFEVKKSNENKDDDFDNIAHFYVTDQMINKSYCDSLGNKTIHHTDHATGHCTGYATDHCTGYATDHCTGYATDHCTGYATAHMDECPNVEGTFVHRIECIEGIGSSDSKFIGGPIFDVAMVFCARRV
jgi:hypothetical protein